MNYQFIFGFITGIASAATILIIVLSFKIDWSYNKEAKLVKFDSEVDRLLEPDHLQEYYNEEFN